MLGRTFNALLRKRGSRRDRRLGILLTLILALLVVAAPRPALSADITVYKSPLCGCCGKWVSYLRARGHRLMVHDRENLEPVKKSLGVPRSLRSCHTAVVEGYVIEGHVPAEDIARLLIERPKAKGIAVPGMPMGSPGMEGPRPEPYRVLLFGADGAPKVFAVH